jgi:hypothetical protein
MDDPTKPEFYSLWSIRDLQVECARLNKILSDINEKIDQTIAEIKR